MALKNFLIIFCFTAVNVLFLISANCENSTNKPPGTRPKPRESNTQVSGQTVYTIGKRAFHDVVVFNNALYVIGGFEGVDESGNEMFRSDVLKSTNGGDWLEIKQNDDTAFSKRAFHAAVAFDDALYVIGGFDGTNTLNDVWKSRDGQNWKKITTTGNFE